METSTSNEQVNVNIETTPGPDVQDEQQEIRAEQDNLTASPSDDFTHIYRTGNFGAQLGKVNREKGQKWLVIQGVLGCTMMSLTAVATAKMKHYNSLPQKNTLLATTWLTSIFDLIITVYGAYFMKKLPTFNHPLSMLMILRLFGVLAWVCNLFFLMTGMTFLFMDTEDVGLTDTEISFVKRIYAAITILMMVKSFTSAVFFFLWWSSCPRCICLCARLAPICIYEKVEELAPGVANSTAVEKMVAMAYIIAGVAQGVSKRISE